MGLAYRGSICLVDVCTIGRMLAGIYNREHLCSPYGRSIGSEHCRHCDQSWALDSQRVMTLRDTTAFFEWLDLKAASSTAPLPDAEPPSGSEP